MIKKQKGFTLVELLVVIGIIGILATLVFVNLSSSRAQARNSVRLAAVDAMVKALEAYYQDYEYYPSSMTAACPVTFICNSTDANVWIPGLADYINSLPHDPLEERFLGFLYMYTTNPIYNFIVGGDFHYILFYYLEGEDHRQFRGNLLQVTAGNSFYYYHVPLE
ncbi:MAG: type II secretion system protein [Patescibacteria group bacterium]